MERPQRREGGRDGASKGFKQAHFLSVACSATDDLQVPNHDIKLCKLFFFPSAFHANKRRL
jgi:hypothetical protein